MLDTPHTFRVDAGPTLGAPVLTLVYRSAGPETHRQRVWRRLYLWGVWIQRGLRLIGY